MLSFSVLSRVLSLQFLYFCFSLQRLKWTGWSGGGQHGGRGVGVGVEDVQDVGGDVVNDIGGDGGGGHFKL